MGEPIHLDLACDTLSEMVVAVGSLACTQVQ
jgi:hypothetical protein